MQSGPGDTGTSAVVIPLDKEHFIRGVAAMMTAQCPGWSIVYLARPGEWMARRRAMPWLCDASTNPGSLVIRAPSFTALYARLNIEAINELVSDFAGWSVRCGPGIDAWAATVPRQLRIEPGEEITAPAPLWLLYSIREYLAMAGAAETEPWFRLWDGTDDVPAQALTAGKVTLDDVIAEIGDRWDCREITGGYVAVPRDSGPGRAIPRVGHIPALLLASVRKADRRS